MASIQTTLSVEYPTKRVCILLTPGCRPQAVSAIAIVLTFCILSAGFYFLVYLQVC